MSCVKNSFKTRVSFSAPSPPSPFVDRLRGNRSLDEAEDDAADRLHSRSASRVYPLMSAMRTTPSPMALISFPASSWARMWPSITPGTKDRNSLALQRRWDLHRSSTRASRRARARPRSDRAAIEIRETRSRTALPKQRARRRKERVEERGAERAAVLAYKIGRARREGSKGLCLVPLSEHNHIAGRTLRAAAPAAKGVARFGWLFILRAPKRPPERRREHIEPRGPANALRRTTIIAAAIIIIFGDTQIQTSRLKHRTRRASADSSTSSSTFGEGVELAAERSSSSISLR